MFEGVCIAHRQARPNLGRLRYRTISVSEKMVAFVAGAQALGENETKRGFPLRSEMGGGLNRSTQHFILEEKDGV